VTVSERPAAPVFANTRSDRVRAIRSLAGCSARSRPPARLVAEGPQSVAEAADVGAVVDLWITPEQDTRLGGLARAVEASGGYVHLATPEVLRAMGPASQGVVAIVDWPEATLADILSAARRGPAPYGAGLPPAPLPGRSAPGGVQATANPAVGSDPRHRALVAVVDECRDPGNAGTVIRAADAAGATGVIFTPTSVDIRSTKVIRASAGSLFHLPVVQGPPIAEVLSDLTAAGLVILAADGAGTHCLDVLLHAAQARFAPTALDPSQGSPSAAACLRGGERGRGAGTDAVAPDLCAATAWVFGNEAHGLSTEARVAADAIVRIPIYGRAESYNLAMAATLCLHASATAQSWLNGARQGHGGA
jgi:TrmH family RNA methyltransferase